MRKIGTAIASTTLALFAIGASAPGAAAASESEFCSGYGDFGFTHGACTSYFNNSHSSAGISSLCKRFENSNSYVFHLFFTNQGDCVSTINYYYKGGS